MRFVLRTAPTVVCVFALVICVCGISAPAAEPVVRVAIYADGGISSKGPPNLERCLPEGKGFTTERIKAAERPQLVEYVGRMAREGHTVTGRKVTIP